MNQLNEREVMTSLINQVQRAARGEVEWKVRTVISRPLWQVWLRAIGEDENAAPTPWNGPDTIRIFGSETVITESTALFSFSFLAYLE